MNRRYPITGFFVALIGLALFWTGHISTPGAIAAATGSHAGHDHAEQDHAAHQDQDLEALFEEQDDAHAGHDHAESPSAHAGHAHGSDDAICTEHNVAEAECALCQGSHIGELQPGQGMKVRLAAPDVASKAGIRLVPPQQVAFAGGTDIPGRVEFDRKQFATITPLASGVLRRVLVQPGASVKQGEVLAEIAMPEVATLKAEYTAALARQAQTAAAYQREQDLLARGISSRQEFQLAEAAYRADQSAAAQYRQQLLNFGLAAIDLERLARAGDTGASVALRAPFAGTVTEVQTATGETVAAGTPLFTVADLDTLWIELAIPESRIFLAEVGAGIQARFDGLPGTVFSGRLFQVGAVLDPRSRTLKALAEVANPGHRLKVGMFGSVRILAGDAAAGLAIPVEAVQNIDGAPYVFIQEEADLFELRRIVSGPVENGLVAIPIGLNADDRVVATQGFALKSELLKARLGASCADH